MKILILIAFSLCLSFGSYAQHDHHVDDNKKTESHGHNHLVHIQSSRAQNFYIHNLPSPKLMTGIGQSKMTIVTKSEKTQAYFNQGVTSYTIFGILKPIVLSEKPLSTIQRRLCLIGDCSKRPVPKKTAYSRV